MRLAKLEGIVKLVQGITPFRPIDLAGDLPAHSVHMMISSTDGFVIENPESQEKEGKLLPFSPTQRVGSSTVGNGAP